MARATLAALIASVRVLITDPVGTPLFSDDQIQEQLDLTRQDVRYLELASAATIAPGGTTTWLDYYAQVGSAKLGDWETDAQIISNTFAVLTPTTSDYLVGHWSFAVDTRPPVYIVGKTFDRYLAAGSLCRMWAASVKLSYGFSMGGQRFDRQQQYAALIEMARQYDAMARPRTLQMVRGDVPEELWTRRNFDISRTSF